LRGITLFHAKYAENLIQEEDEQSISDDVEANSELKKMINESREQYKQGLGMSTVELLKSFSPKDFI
jgi:hypothetical protein